MASGRNNTCLSMVGNMCVIIYSFNLNISLKMSYGVLKCDIVVTQLHAYDFVTKYFVVKSGFICTGPYLYLCLYLSINLYR